MGVRYGFGVGGKWVVVIRAGWGELGVAAYHGKEGLPLLGGEVFGIGMVGGVLCYSLTLWNKL